MGLNTLPCSVDVSIACWPWGAYLGDDALTKGIRLKISSWTRHDHNIMPPAAKTTGNYVNSSLAEIEAVKAGYDRSEEHTSELQSLMRISYAVFCLKNKNKTH